MCLITTKRIVPGVSTCVVLVERPLPELSTLIKEAIDWSEKKSRAVLLTDGLTLQSEKGEVLGKLIEHIDACLTKSSDSNEKSMDVFTQPIDELVARCAVEFCQTRSDMASCDA